MDERERRILTAIIITAPRVAIGVLVLVVVLIGLSMVKPAP